MANELHVKSFTPLWHHDSYCHMTDLIEHGFELLFTSVSADGLDEKWLGTVLNSDSLSRLYELSEQHRFSIDGEGGEFETTIVKAPWMKKRIKLCAFYLKNSLIKVLFIRETTLSTGIL